MTASRFRTVGLGLASLLLLPSADARAIVIRDDQPDADYLGLATSYPMVAAWVHSTGLCSATIVEVTGVDGYALTGAHCVGGSLGTLYLGADRAAPSATHAVVDAVKHPGFDGSPDHDLAVIRFTGASGATPVATIYTGVDPIGRAGTLVGFGQIGTGLTGGTVGSTLERAAMNDIDAYGAGGSTLLLDFDDPVDAGASSLGSAVPLTLEGLPCSGDTGGGIFADFGDGPELVGTVASVSDASGGALCDYGDVALAVNLVENFDFLNLEIYGGIEVLKVPEPAAGALAGCALSTLGWLRRTRRRAAVPAPAAEAETAPGPA